MPETVHTALQIARARLSDVKQNTWADYKLLAFMPEAFQTMLLDLSLNGVDFTKAVSAEIPVTAGDVQLTLPANFLELIELYEKPASAAATEFRPVQEYDSIPFVAPSSSIDYWANISGNIQINPPTTNRTVLIRYTRKVVSPRILTDSLQIDYAEVYLGAQIAGLCLQSVNSPNAQSHIEAARAALTKMLQFYVRGQQRTIHRLPFRRRTGVVR